MLQEHEGVIIAFIVNFLELVVDASCYIPHQQLIFHNCRPCDGIFMKMMAEESVLLHSTNYTGFWCRLRSLLQTHYPDVHKKVDTNYTGPFPPLLVYKMTAIQHQRRYV